VGDPGLEHPPYPGAALRARITGTVTLRVSFGATGEIDQCEVISSSGSALLDFATKDFATSNWHKAELAGQTKTIPVIYRL
jgi:TonB family protein